MTLKNNIEQWLRLECSVPLCLLTWDHSIWGWWAHPVGLVHRWAWQGCHRSLGAVARVDGGKGRIWKEHSLGGFSSGVLCPFCAMKGRKWGRSASQGSEPTKPPVFRVGERKKY